MAKSSKKPAVGVASVKRNNNLPVILGGAALVIVLLAVAVILTVSGGSDDSSDGREKFEYQALTVNGNPLPGEYQNDGSTRIDASGAQAPDLIGKDFVGDTVEIKNDGKPKVVVFFAHWCPHCQKELPLMSNWLKSNRSKYSDVQFYGVATATTNTRPNFPPSKWFDKEDWNQPVLVDNRDNAAATAYGLGSYPYMVVLGPDNKVITRTSGELSMTDFEALVKQAADSKKAAQNGSTTSAPGSTSTTVASGASSPAQ